MPLYNRSFLLCSETSKINWADDAATGQLEQRRKLASSILILSFFTGDDSQRVESEYDENGIKTVVEYRTDEQGRKLKVRRLA